MPVQKPKTDWYLSESASDNPGLQTVSVRDLIVGHLQIYNNKSTLYDYDQI